MTPRRLVLATLALAGSVGAAAAQTVPPVSSVAVADAPPPAQATPLSLDQLEARALAGHPAIAAAAAAVNGVRGDARQASLLPNPTIAYDLEDFAARDGRSAGEQTVAWQQTIPLGGKLRVRREALLAQADAAGAALDRVRQEVLNGVRVHYYAALAAQQRRGVQARLAALAGEAVNISSQLLNVGAADRPDVLAVQIEQERRQVDLLRASNQATRAWRELTIAVGEPTLPEQALGDGLDGEWPTFAHDTLLAEVLAGHPGLATVRARIVAAERDLTRARRDVVPDLTVRGGPRYDRSLATLADAVGGWTWVAGATVGLPLVNRNQGAIAAAQATVTQTRETLRAEELEVRMRFEAQFERYLSALGEAERYRASILPKAEEAHRLYLGRYREMAAAYPQVLIAQRALFDAAGRYVDVLEDLWQASAALRGFVIGAAER